jgi:hypothetical protein
MEHDFLALAFGDVRVVLDNPSARMVENSDLGVI